MTRRKIFHVSLFYVFILIGLLSESSAEKDELQFEDDNNLKNIQHVERKTDSKRMRAVAYDIGTQPRMYTSSGHLMFETAGTFNISFRTNEQGTINFNDIDLKPLLAQVEKNRLDIVDIKNGGGGGTTPDSQVETNKQNIENLQTQTNSHNDRLDVLEDNYDALQSTVTAIQNDLNTDDCASTPCKNGGSCIDLYKDFSCSCPSTYEGSTCETDHDECNDFLSTGIGCQNGGTCKNLPGGFECDCPNSYYGPLCTSMYDDCFDGDVAKCVHGVCLNSPRDDPNVPKYSCICESGWASVSDTNPACTRDVDECLDFPCSSNPPVQCFNTQGSFTCGSCPSGYQGNGYSCSDIDECVTNNGGCSQSPMVNCINVPGTSHCASCPPGYVGDGYTCTQQDPCTNNGGCHPIAACSYNPAIGTVSCTCPPGYNGNGVGPYGCTLTDSNCTDTCVNGQCVMVSGILACVCDPGWIGDNCDYNSNECSSNPCQHGGMCTDGVNGYSCSCTSGYIGTNCELQQSACGGEYRTSSGSFQYPANAGDTYPASSSCTWTVVVADGKVISTTFPRFDIESSAGCANDFLQINDGPSLSSQLVGRFCGTTSPGNGDALVSTSHQLYFWFSSNAVTNRNGFQVVWTTEDPVCGGDITGQDFGTISSPGYPGVYPGQRDCYWSISVQPGNVIQFLFGTIALEEHANCSADYLEIRDGILLNDPVLARYCSSISPPPLLTTAPGALLHFHSDQDNSDLGFHITWTKQPVGISGCGGYFTEDDGVIISPNYPNTYTNDQQCVWQIHIEENGQISVTFTDLDIPTELNCANEYLEIRDGPSESSPLVGRYCGTTIPPMYTSSGRDMYLNFKSDKYITGRGFRIEYTVACGGTYTDETGMLLSPYYSSNYPNGKECLYTIRQPPGYIITLTVVEMDIEDSPSCSADYLESHDGPTEESPLLGLICGKSLPPPMMSTQNYMFVHFNSDSQNNGGGFQATYTSTNTGCGGVYTDTVGSIKSPGHPSPYPHGVNCTYYIWVDPSLIINLQFLTFSLEAATNGVCEKDFIEVFDGPNVMAPSLGRFCGSVIPPNLVSKSYEMTIFFSTDDNEDSQGFAAAYTTLNASTACGGRVTDKEGYISSPNYPEFYPAMRTCVWTIVMPAATQIQVDFPDFDFEGGNGEGTCSFDYLEIRNGGYEDSPLIGQFCGGTNPGTFISHSNELYIKMVTDEYQEGRGFLMNYNGGLTGCGGTLTSADGGFQSPNYPFAYPHATECYWLIQISEGSTIRLIFVNFDIETHGYCEFDYLEAYDGATTGHPRLGRVCGTRIPEPFESTDNSMLVKFRSDGNTAGSGFVVQYHTNCDRTITSKASGLIQSLDYPGNYPPNRDCTWTVQGSLGNPINATFRSFSLETCDGCTCDSVEVYDGDDSSSSPSFGKFCGSQNPPIIRTTGYYLQVVFHTDPYVQAPGFELAWAVDGCGDTFTAPTGSFASPNYPNNYDHDKECIWQIITEIGTNIQLTIDDFDVEQHSDCRYDTLEVYNGLFVDDDFRIAQLCNSQNPPQIPMHVSSTSSFMTIRFISDYSVNGRGFHASYEQQAGGCGGYLTSRSGTITSPNYPNEYPPNTDCEWLINVGVGSTVVVEFEIFEIEEEPLCEYDYVALIDGSNATGDPLLLKTCGKTLPPIVQSSAHIMLFIFHSDPFIPHVGFKAHYSAGCGGKVVADNSIHNEITSPDYPKNYPADTNCTWTISAPPAAQHVTIQFTQLNLYSNASYNGPCGRYDYIKIFDGPLTTSPEFGTYCGTTIPTLLTSLSNSFTLQFVSQSSEQKSGFRALYTSSTSQCGGELEAQSGYFNSPRYPDEYPVDTDCVWIIRSSPGNRIQLTFLSLDLEYHDSCLFDYVSVSEGVNGAVLVRYCGGTLPPDTTSITGHILYVKFHSDVAGVGGGFHAYYQHLYGSTTIGLFSGAIASPMYPASYPDLIDAFYYVYAPAGRLITYQFSSFDVQGHIEEGCIYDGVLIYDGDTVSAPLLTFACGSFTPPQSTTTQGAMLLRFHSDLGISGGGFYLTWTAIDGGGIGPNPTNVPTIEPGVCGSNHMVAALAALPLYSPGWPDYYPSLQDCQWLIEAAPGHRVEFTILTIDMESGAVFCDFDFLILYDGSDTLTPSLGKYCGKYPPADPIYSTGEFMLVRFKSDQTISLQGFSATYQQGCGGTITSNQGVLESPNYPGNYPLNTDCLWIITASLGYTISLDFNDEFDIKNSDSSSCEENSGDYVKILNGRESDAPPLPGVDGSGRYCGNTAPTGLTTSSHFLYVVFKSDGQNAGKGFSLTYTAAGTGCGGNLQLTDQLTSGTFSSPDYPSTYPHGADCVWIISAPAGEAIQLDFTSFNLEGGTTCQYDYVLIVDGQTSNDPVLGKYCTFNQPPTTKSSGNTMLVRFRTDETQAHGGFQATYKIAECGGTIIGTSAIITSPNYPGNYPDSTTCDWQIRGPMYHFLHFTITDLNLFTSDECGDGAGDYIEFRMANTSEPAFNTVCGNVIPALIDTEDNIAHIKFRSDGSDNAKGFRIEYTVSEDICGGELTGLGGTLMTPNYPNSYDHARICTWLITVAEDRRVTLTFNAFDLEEPFPDYGCVFDFVEVFNGIQPNSPKRVRLCGSNLPGSIESTGNTMKVLFRTDDSVSHGGFLATYTSTQPRVCGGLLNDPEGGIFTTPNYPNNYQNYQECIWTIANPNMANSTILIAFNEFSLEHHIVCTYDMVTFKAGIDYSGYSYKTLCGDTKPSPFGLALPDAFVQFTSDYAVTDKGFEATYAFKPCGGLVTGTSNGVISSPNYPNPYNNNDYCLWTIAVPQGQHIKLHWTSFHVESHSSCGYDYVKIYNGPTPASPLVGNYCNNNAPTDYTAGSNTITILFQSDYSVPHDGWQVEWEADISGCGNVIIHKHSGEIMSPDYPNNYAGNLNCIWTVITDPAYHIDVTFDEVFSIEQHAQCVFDYVAVYDGASEFAPKIDQFCGVSTSSTAPDSDTVLESSEAAITLRFASDFGISSTGFKAYYEAHCGLTLLKESGTFQTPNYPAPYNNDEHCLYLITSSAATKFIKLTFKRFDLEAGSAVTLCDYDYVTVYAGNSTSSKQIGKYCGNIVPTNALSSEGSMLIEFSTDAVTIDYGFLAEYETADCGGLLTKTSGSINAFTHSDLHHNRNCTWVIQVDEIKVVELEFTSFDIEAHGSCSYDYVKVYDGPSTFSPLIGIYCGTFIPKYLISSTNNMTIEFITDQATTAEGFTSRYKQMAGPLEGCGGILTSSTGSFASLDLDGDGNYDANMNCLWLIQAQPNEIITISFSEFMLENATSKGCIYDKVEIHDGQTEFDSIAVTACGILAPVPFTSSGNFLSIRFIADAYVQYTGFIANYTTQLRTCGGQYMATDEVKDLSYPPASLTDTRNVNCRWVIDAGTDLTRYIMITFMYVDIRSPVNSGTNCNSAYLEVKDYPPGDTGQSFQYCNNSHNAVDFHSFGQVVQVNLRTDSETTGRGFYMQYQLTNCSRNINQSYGQLFNPGWPDLYPHITECITVITVPEGNQLQMFFNLFELEYEENCAYDYLEIRDGPDASSPLLQKLCGFSLPNPIFPTSNSVYMKLYSDPFVHEKGYDITYTSTDGVCGGIVTGDHGTITSFGFPQAYQPNSTCDFSIQAPSGRPVTAHIRFMDIYYKCDDAGCRCDNDALRFYAGPDINSPYIIGYCGYGNIADIQSPVNSIFVRFAVGDFVNGTRSNTGFRVEFES